MALGNDILEYDGSVRRDLKPAALNKLVVFLSTLPGIGKKSATRYAMNLINWPQEMLVEFGELLKTLHQSVKRCSFCNLIADTDPCQVCASTQRDESQILLVENSIQAYKIEELGVYNGLYFVVDVEDMQSRSDEQQNRLIKMLVRRVCYLTDKNRKNLEVISGLGLSMHSQAFILALQEQLDKRCSNMPPRFSRLAVGLSAGASIDFADAYTLRTAIINRQQISD